LRKKMNTAGVSGLRTDDSAIDNSQNSSGGIDVTPVHCKTYSLLGAVNLNFVVR
jgi:hypothetical protein